MPSVTDFLPSYIRQFMNLVTTGSPNLASGRTSLLIAARRRDMSPPPLLRPLGAVLRAPLVPVLDALGVEGAADDVVAHARQVLHAAAADHHHRVLLQVVTDAGDVAGHLEAVREPHARDLAQRRVRLLWRGDVDARAHTALLRTRFQRRHLVARGLRPARAADELVDRRHRSRTSFQAATPRDVPFALPPRFAGMIPKIMRRLAGRRATELGLQGCV